MLPKSIKNEGAQKQNKNKTKQKEAEEEKGKDEGSDGEPALKGGRGGENSPCSEMRLNS